MTEYNKKRLIGPVLLNLDKRVPDRKCYCFVLWFMKKYVFKYFYWASLFPQGCTLLNVNALRPVIYKKTF